MRLINGEVELSRVNTAKISNDIAEHVRKFLEGGGEIEEVDRGTIASDRGTTKNQKAEEKARKNGCKKSAENKK